MELTQDYAQAKAQNWVDAWNSRDLDGVMAHYSENVAVCSPLVTRRYPQSNGWIKGKSALRDYFRSAWAIPICDSHCTLSFLGIMPCQLFTCVKMISVSLTRWSWMKMD